MTDVEVHEDFFCCTACHETYRKHWRDQTDARLCRTCGARGREECVFGDCSVHRRDHPCSYGSEGPGTPCRYCGEPVPQGGAPCSKCWLSFEAISFADIRATFVKDGTFSTSPEVNWA